MSQSKDTDNTTASRPVIIAGGGWSGLACAVTLARHGVKVHLLESARQTGGRARGVLFKKPFPEIRPEQHSSEQQTVDNGQHIMLGAYHATLSLFKTIGLDEAQILDRQRLSLNLFSPLKPFICLSTPPLPAPLHLIAGLINLRGISLAERFSAIKMSLLLALKKYSLKADISVHELLKHYGQSAQLIQVLWEPLCLATMNTPIQHASAQVFVNVLKDSFSRHRADSDLLFFKKDLSQVFCQPAQKYIHEHNGSISLASKVRQVTIKHATKKDFCDFIISTKDMDYHTDTLVLATPPRITDSLLHSQTNCSTMHSSSFLIPRNADLTYYYEPICTIYLYYPPTVQLASTMVGFIDTIGQWAVDRSVCRQAGLIAVVISGPGKHIHMPHKQLAAIIHNELIVCMPDLPQWLDYRIITEHKATFSCRVNIEARRPHNKTIIPGLFLAGDYTNTHYPATLESAVKSGIQAAEQVLLHHR